MISEPQRLQYLDAMGLTAWVARYQLPTARPSEVCDWPELRTEQSTEGQPKVAPSERLQALLTPEASPAPVSQAGQARSESEAPSRASMPRRARALLDDLTPENAEAGRPTPEVASQAGTKTQQVATTTERASSPESAPRAQAQAEPSWQFSLQVACLDGRWLVVTPGQQALSAVEVRLLANLFAAAGMALEQPPSLEDYRWPPVTGASLQVMSQDPGQDARDGLCAFLHGRQRLAGWAPRRAFAFGMDETLEALLAIDGQHSATLDLPLWQGPELGTLSTSAEAKRALWPRLLAWRSFEQ